MLGLLLAAEPCPAGPPPPALAWVPAPDPRLARLPEAASGDEATPPPAPLAPGAPVELGRGDLLLHPVHPGSIVRVVGWNLRVGFATGVLATPDSIVWYPRSPRDKLGRPLPNGRRERGYELRVPTWSGARFLVVTPRTRGPSWATIELAAGASDAMAWYRLDADVADALTEARPTQPPAGAPTPEAEALLRQLDAAQRALEASYIDASDADRERLRRATSAWLQARWLDATLAWRPTVYPFFQRRELGLRGGSAPPPNSALALGREPDAPPVRVLPSGGSIDVVGTADIAALWVRARAVGKTHVRVTQGDATLAEFAIAVPQRREDPERWTPARGLKVSLAPGAPLRVRALSGTLAVSAFGYDRQTHTFDSTGLRSVAASLARAERALRDVSDRQRAGYQALAACIAFERHRDRKTHRALERLASTTQDARLEAFLWGYLIARGAGVGDDREKIQALFAATEILPDEDALAFQRAALDSLLGTHSEPFPEPANFWIPPPLESVLRAPPRGTAADREVVPLLGAAAFPTRDAGRPRFAARAELLAHLETAGESADALAREVWARTAPWRALEAEFGVPTRTLWREPSVDAPQGRCLIDGAAGLRWTRLVGTRDLAVRASSGSHVRAVIRAETDRSADDVPLRIDDVDVPIHASIGKGSVVALAPGTHRFVNPSGGSTALTPLLASIPRDGTDECSSLRQPERWTVVDSSADFSLPSGAATAASIVVAPESLGGTSAHFRVIVGDRSYQVWVGAQTSGALEVPVPAHTTQLRIETPRRLWLRVRARLHPAPERTRRLRPQSVSVEHPDEASLLEQVRAASRALHQSALAERERALGSAYEAAKQALEESEYAERQSALRLEREKRRRDELRLQRAQALEDLGYTQLAEIDRSRVSPQRRAPLGRGDDDDVEAGGSDLRLPPGSPSTIPLGFFARIPPLPRPVHSARLSLTVQGQSSGDSDSAARARLGDSADTSTAADALLLAHLADGLDETQTAADAYARVGQARGCGLCLARAALLRADLAATSGDLNDTMRAYSLARDATDLGANAGGTLARLEDSISWQVAEVTGGAGVAYVEQFADPDGERSLAERVRRALVDAPSRARLTRRRELTFPVRRVTSGRLALRWLCHFVSGPDERCTPHLSIDSRPTPGPLPGASDPSVTSPEGCELELPEGARNVSVAPPSEETALLWAIPQELSNGGAAPLSTVTAWTEIDAERPYELELVGPTVVRVTARAYADSAHAIEFRVRGELEVTEQRELDPTLDPHAKRLHPETPVTRLTRRYFAVASSGVHVLSLRVGHGRALIRVEVADASRPPQLRDIERALSSEAVPEASAPSAREPDRWLLAVGEDPPAGPLSFELTLSAVDADLSDAEDNNRDRHLELAAAARRTWLSNTVWSRLSLLTRAREGDDSYGANAQLLASPSGVLPGGFVRAHSAFQSHGGTWAHGHRVSLSVNHRIELAPHLGLLPSLTYTERWVDPEVARRYQRGESGVQDADRDVYSPYSASRPRSLDAALAANLRSHVDSLVGASLGTRLSPAFDGFDRIELGGKWQYLPGRGWSPWLRMDAIASLRPVSPQRDTGFTRFSLIPSVTFWRWTSPSGRWSFGGSTSAFVDVYDERQQGAFAGSLFLGYDRVWGNGLTHRTFANRPFPQRLEEGVAAPRRDVPRGDADWEPRDE